MSKIERKAGGERDYAGTEERDAIAMVLAFGNMGHFLHGSTIGQYVPFASESFIMQEIEESLWRHG